MDRWRKTETHSEFRENANISGFVYLIKLLLTCLILLSAAVEHANSEGLKCTTIARCPEVNQGVDTRRNISWREMRRIEDDIALEKHWNGFRPLEYNLTFNFKDFPDFSGTVNIRGAIVKTTRRLSVNINSAYIDHIYDNMSISYCALRHIDQICIAYTAFTWPYEYLELTLNDTLETETECIINLYFKNLFDRSVTINETAIGLRVFQTDAYTIANTEFKLRNAQTVFPCLDHPSLKARFNVIIISHGRFYVVGNSASVVRKRSPKDARLTMYTFHVAVPISTHEFGFAMFSGFEVFENYQFSNIRMVESRSTYSSNFMLFRMFDDVASSVRVLTNLRFPSHNITYVIMPDVTYSFLDCYRLVFLNPASLTFDRSLKIDNTVLFETVFRQAIAGSFSESKWNEICLREGLVKFFRQVLKNRQLTRNNDVVAMESVEEICKNRHISLTKENDTPFLDASRCEHGAKEFYMSFSNIFGLHAMQKLLNNLITRYPNEAITIRQWSYEMAEVSGYPEELSTYAKNHFQQSTIVALFLNYSLETYALDVRVRDTDTSALPIPVRVYFALQPEPDTIVISSKSREFFNSDRDDWALVDPDGDTCTVKIYGDKSLSALLNPDIGDIYGHVTKKRKQRLVSNFCYALMNRIILYEGTEPSKEWRLVFEYAYDLDASCKCCLVPRNVTVECNEEKFAVCDRLVYFKLL